MAFAEWVSLISLLVAFVALIYSIISNTKRYELTYQYYQDVVAWHNEAVNTIMSLKHQSEDKEVLLAKLSALIETGRFYFPNIDSKDSFGKEKPLAYQGYRNVVLDFLVYEYQLFEKDDSEKFIPHSESLQRLFTSYVFQHLEPKKHKKKVKQNTSIHMKNEFTINEFLNNSPESIYAFFPIDSNEKNWTTIPTKR